MFVMVREVCGLWFVVCGKFSFHFQSLTQGELFSITGSTAAAAKLQS
jgi:hypothetical protein